MRVLVVYESMFGHTEAVARTVAEGLADTCEVTVSAVDHLPVDWAEGLDVLVLGAPTHAFGLPTAASRQSALDQAEGLPLVTRGTGIRELVDQVDTSTCPYFATFDTHVLSRWLPGSASVRASRALRRAGLTPLTGPASFYVHGSTGPLADGELERARAWSKALGAELASVAAHR